MNPITRKSVSELVMQPSFRAVGQTHAEWQTFEKPENKCMAVSPPKPYGHTFASNLQVFQSSETWLLIVVIQGAHTFP